MALAPCSVTPSPGLLPPHIPVVFLGIPQPKAFGLAVLLRRGMIAGDCPAIKQSARIDQQRGFSLPDCQREKSLEGKKDLGDQVVGHGDLVHLVQLLDGSL